MTVVQDATERFSAREAAATAYAEKVELTREVLRWAQDTYGDGLTVASSMGDEVLVVGPISLDRAQREVMIEGKPVKLTFSEFELLDALMTDPGRLLNRQELLRAIWGDSAYRDPRAIDVHIRHLREKLEPEPEKPRYILTVRGAGYRLRGS